MPTSRPFHRLAVGIETAIFRRSVVRDSQCHSRDHMTDGLHQALDSRRCTLSSQQ